jgi:hypothetical protein
VFIIRAIDYQPAAGKLWFRPMKLLAARAALTDQQEFLGGDFRFHISDFTSHFSQSKKIYQHTLHFYATTPIKHKMKYGHN